MDWVGPPDAILIRRVAGFARKVVGVLAVHLDIRSCGGAYRGECPGVGLLEQTLLHDVIRLVRRSWPPLIGYTTYDVLEPLECFEAVGAANLLCVPGGDLVRVVTGFRRRDRDGQQDA